MRSLGLILLLAGVLFFFYCSTQMSSLEPVPEGTALGRYLEYEAGKWELARYGAAILALIGAILSFFPKGG